MLVPLEDAEVERVVAEMRHVERGRGERSVCCSAISTTPTNADWVTRLRRTAAGCSRHAVECGGSGVSRISAHCDDRHQRRPCDPSSAAYMPAGPRRPHAESGVAAPFLVMQSNGGSVPAARAEENAHRLVLSGPAGGVAGLVATASRHGLGQRHQPGHGRHVDRRLPGARRAHAVPPPPRPCVITCCWRPRWTSTRSARGVAASRGRDQTGRLRVGPQSAGAVPAAPPAICVAGTQPTITDAHVVLGDAGAGAVGG